MATINYNGVELDLQEFLTNAANEVQRYADSQPWSNKRKQKFLDAYTDIMNHGVLGASIGENGIWNIDHNGIIDQTNMSKMDRQMYGEAAYFIQQLMNSLGTKNTKKEEEELKKELPKFDNFGDNFGDYINKKYYGRSGDFSLKDLWNILDDRNTTTGLLNTSKRLAALKDYLTNYRDSLQEGLYDFTDSPFESLDDLKSRLNNAIEGLNNGDINAINLIGLDPKQWFYNGSSDVVGTDENGNPITYVQQAEAANKIAETKAIEDALKANAIAQANRGVRDILSGIHGSDARTNPEGYANKLAEKYGVGLEGFNRVNQRIQELFDKAYDTKVLNNADKKELGNLLFYIRQNNENYKTSNLSNEEWNELNKYQLSDTNRNNYVHLPWKTTRDGRNIFADGQGNVHFVKYSNKANLPNAFKRSLAAIDYRNNFLKSNLQLKSEESWNSDKGILISDGISMLGDLVSLGGGAAGVAGGVTSLLADVSSDILRGKNLWDVTKGIGKNALWTIAGVIPGARLGKVARTAARVWAGINSLGIITDPNIHKSWNKLINGQDFTAQDLENIKYTLHAIAGGTNVARGVATLRKIDQALGKETYSVKTKTGTKSATKEQINEINKVGRLSGLKAAEDKFKDTFKEEAAEGSFKFGESSRSRLNPARYTSRITSDKLLKGEKSTVRDNAAIQELINIDRAKPWLANPFRAKTWSDFITASGSNRGAYGYIFNINNNKSEYIKPNTLSKSPLWELQLKNPTEREWNNKAKYTKPNTTSEPVLRVESGKAKYETPRALRRLINKPNLKNESNNTSRESLREIKDFKLMYINSTKGKKSTSFKNGYGTSKEPQIGKYKLPNNGTFEITKDLFGNYELRIGNNKPMIFNRALELRSTLALHINKQLGDSKRVKQNANLLIWYKNKGLLKQGGQINRNVDTIISEFLSKLI